jgi:hypothetical protein
MILWMEDGVNRKFHRLLPGWLLLSGCAAQVEMPYPDHPTVQRQINMPGFARRLALEGESLYMAESESALLVLDVQKP